MGGMNRTFVIAFGERGPATERHPYVKIIIPILNYLHRYYRVILVQEQSLYRNI
jgi:hypothetical protein